MAKYTFGEKREEYSTRKGTNIPVWLSPKYEQSREKAIEIIEKYDNISEGDFWILMNETKTGKMAYTGLIISHNACLKLNDNMPEEKKFIPSCVSIDKDGYLNSLVYTYKNDKQGIYEIGEVSATNCKNAYPYAMAFKRCFDRVVLKLSKLAYDGVYSDSEADEFKEKVDADPVKSDNTKKTRQELEDRIVEICDAKRLSVADLCKKCGVTELSELSENRLPGCISWLESM